MDKLYRFSLVTIVYCWNWAKIKPGKWAKIDQENLDLGDKILLATLFLNIIIYIPLIYECKVLNSFFSERKFEELKH